MHYLNPFEKSLAELLASNTPRIRRLGHATRDVGDTLYLCRQMAEAVLGEGKWNGADVVALVMLVQRREAELTKQPEEPS